MSMDNLNRIASELQNPSVGMDRLAQYAQGTNPLIPQYMALAEIQRRQDLTKLEPGQASTTTVAQDLVSKALAPQAPMGGMPGMAPQQMPQQEPQGVAGLQAPQGVAALPSGMGQQSFAGGGIVAFDEGSKKAVEDPDVLTADQMQQIANRGSLQNSPEQIAQKQKENAVFFSGLGNYVPNVSGALQSVKDYMYSDPRSKILSKAQAGTLTQADLNATKNNSTTTPTNNSGFYDNAEYGGPQIGVKPPADKNTQPDLTYKNKVGSIDPNAQAPGIQPKSDAANQYIEMLKEQMAEGKAGKEQDKYLRLLEAGLGIMGGTSPYAAVNIGAGATPAVRGYAQDVAAAGKANRETIGQMATIQTKQQELAQEAAKTAITKDHYERMDTNDRAKIGVLSQANGDAKTAAGVSAIFGKLADAHKNDIDKGDLDYATLYQQAQQMYNSTTGKNVGSAGAATAQPKIPKFDPITNTFS